MTIKQEKLILDNNTKMVEFMAQIRDAIHEINDTNKLHCTSITENTNVIKSMVKSNDSFLQVFRWVLYALVLAVITLAGVEKIVKLPWF